MNSAKLFTLCLMLISLLVPQFLTKYKKSPNRIKRIVFWIVYVVVFAIALIVAALIEYFVERTFLS